MTLEEKIYTLRKKSGLSQDEMAQKLGVTRQAVYKWESGIASPEIDKIKAISNLFDVSFDYLLNDDIDNYDFDKKEETQKKTVNRSVFLVADKQDPDQGDIDHGYIQERIIADPSLSAKCFVERKASAKKTMKKAGATEIIFLNESENIAFFYDDVAKVIGFYYGCAIQIVCPIENVVTFKCYSAVNSALIYRDGDSIKEFNISFNFWHKYIAREYFSFTSIQIACDKFKGKTLTELYKLQTKIEILRDSAPTLVFSDTPDINKELYEKINVDARDEYSMFREKTVCQARGINYDNIQARRAKSQLNKELTEEKEPSDEDKIKKIVYNVGMAVGIAMVIILIFIIFCSDMNLALTCSFFALIGLIPAFLAKKASRSFIKWWIYGTFLFLIAIIHVYFIYQEEMKE